MTRTPIAATLGVLLALAGLLVLPAGPASAQGKHGPVAWGSSPIACSYSGATLSQVTVTPPKAAMDKALARQGGTAQYVGVRVVLQGLASGHWKRVAQRPSKRGYAATVLVHPRKKSSVRHASMLTFKGGVLGAAYSSFRAKVTLEWYAYDGKHVRGRAAEVTGSCSRTAPPHAVQVDSGNGFACARMSDQTVRCWGANNAGQLGNGTTTNSARPVAVPGLGGVTSFGVGYNGACAVVHGGTGGVAKCWGANTSAQLGDGTLVNRTSPTPVASLPNAVTVFVGLSASCATTTTVRLACWGANAEGEVGNGGTTNVPTPVTLPASAISVIGSVDIGYDVGCAAGNGGLWCWGGNKYGQLGTTPSSAIAPFNVSSSRLPAFVGVGKVTTGSGFECAIVSGGAIECLGTNTVGQLGGGTTDATPTHKVVKVSGITGATDVSAVGNEACAVAGGTVYCWGVNDSGQLGTGTTISSIVPRPVAGVSHAVGVTVTTTNGYAWDAAGHVWGWGSNTSGQLGIGAPDSDLHGPTPITVR